MGLITSNTCTHCTKNTIDNYFHAFWHCTPVQQFWVQVTDHLSHILGCHIPLSPKLCLLGDMSTVQLNNHIKTTLYTALAVAKKTILLNWKARDQLNIIHWKNLLIDQISIEKMSASLNHNTPRFNKTWSTFINKLLTFA